MTRRGWSSRPLGVIIIAAAIMTVAVAASGASRDFAQASSGKAAASRPGATRTPARLVLLTGPTGPTGTTGPTGPTGTTGPPTMGATFPMLSQPPIARGPAAALAIDANGTVWLADADPPFTGGRGPIRVTARAAGGRVLRTVKVHPAAGFVVTPPLIAASGDRATVVWMTWKDPDPNRRVTQRVEAMSCTISSCAAVQLVASWVSAPIPQQYAPDDTYGGPALASSDGHSVIVFLRTAGSAKELVWAASSGGRFGPIHRLAGNGHYPALTATSGADVLATWVLYGHTGESIQWARWSPAGFGHVTTLTRIKARAYVAALQIASTEGAAMIAWSAGDRDSQPIFTARNAGRGFTAPERVVDTPTSGPAVAAGGGRFVLAFLNFANVNVNATPLVAPLQVMVSQDGGALGAAQVLDQHAQSSPDVGVDERGDVAVGWLTDDSPAQVDCTSQRCSAVATFATPGGAFGAPLTLGPAFYSSPLVASAGSYTSFVWIPVQPAPGGLFHDGGTYQGVVAKSR